MPWQADYSLPLRASCKLAKDKVCSDWVSPSGQGKKRKKNREHSILYSVKCSTGTKVVTCRKKFLTALHLSFSIRNAFLYSCFNYFLSLQAQILHFSNQDVWLINPDCRQRVLKIRNLSPQDELRSGRQRWWLKSAKIQRSAAACQILAGFEHISLVSIQEGGPTGCAVLLSWYSITSNVIVNTELTSEKYQFSELMQSEALKTNKSIYIVHFFLPANMEKSTTIPDHDVRDT